MVQPPAGPGMAERGPARGEDLGGPELAAPRPGPGSTAQAALNVIALVSGGKDSFFSLLHCLANGHRVVALANLHPPLDAGPGPGPDNDPDTDTDLNSFMYQTVGHQVIPLYAEATGIPLYRAPIVGAAVQTGTDYDSSARRRGGEPSRTNCRDDDDHDETESMTTLLQTVKAAHPEADAVCAGAILSTYQRTRVESVAVRLGLVPLAFLWQYPLLPLPLPIPSLPQNNRTTGETSSYTNDDDDGARLLRDMGAAGLRALIIKVASGGLDESSLRQDVTSPAHIARVARAMARFGGGDRGAVLGEGGEFETLVVDGPRCLFGAAAVDLGSDADDIAVVNEGGGTSWLNIRRARLAPKLPVDYDLKVKPASELVKIPDLLDRRFAAVLQEDDPSLPWGKSLSVARGRLVSPQLPLTAAQAEGRGGPADLGPERVSEAAVRSSLEQWSFVAKHPDGYGEPWATVEEQMRNVTDQIRARLTERSLEPTAVTSAVVALRRMADFPTINPIYGAIFTAPNPPSRVTISCGGELPLDCGDVLVILTVHTDPGHDRQGLHVQSRSYWAPANIGPYSQAISIPVSRALVTSAPVTSSGVKSIGGEDEDDEEVTSSTDDNSSKPCPRLVFVAGQIPLVPSTMDLPPPPLPSPSSSVGGSWKTSFIQQAVLALQHLWRIGAEMRVQWWGSVVAYVPRDTSPDPLRGLLALKEKARIASYVWHEAHRLARDGQPWAPPPRDGDAEEEEESGSGPDLWDRRYNAAFPTFGGGGSGGGDGSGARGVNAVPPLPDFETVRFATEPPSPPLFFLAEVDELPRKAAVEWHAHVGFSDVRPRSVAVSTWPIRFNHPVSTSNPEMRSDVVGLASEAAAAGRDGVSLVHRASTLKMSHDQSSSPLEDRALLHQQGRRQGPETDSPGSSTSMDLWYENGGFMPKPSPRAESEASHSAIRCLSLWDSSGEQLQYVHIHAETRAAAGGCM